MSFLSILLTIVMLLIVPVLVGNGICEFFRLDKNIVKYYFYGMFSLWAFIQVISVPLILLRANFNVVVLLIISFILAISIYGLIKNRNFINIKDLNNKEKIAIAALLVFSIFFMYMNFAYQHVDEDDSRFVVNAVDILASNKVLLTNPATGEEIPGFILSDSDKDVVSPWAIFIAFIAKMTMNKVVIVAHTTLPLALIVLSICTFLIVAEKIFGKNIILQVMLTSLMLLIILFGYSYLWTMITMYIGRLWQGKSVVASIGIPALFTSLFDYYDDLSAIKKVIIINLGICLLSGMGIVIGAIIIGCFAVGFFISKRNFKMTFYLLLVAIINCVYFLLEINI